MTVGLVDLLLETTLAISVAASVILLLRRPLRRLIGARSAYALWLLLPAAGLAVLLPARRVMLELPLDEPVPQAAATMLAQVAIKAPFDVTPWLLAFWTAGALAVALGLVWQQRRFRRALGRLRLRGEGILQAEHADAGPAVIGLWRGRIVLPADFDSRYSELERDLVLRHERAHLARRDPFANLLAAALRCVYWFNPLLHYAVGRFRFDQELAVDATVLAQRPEARRSYADAMLKTQLMFEPPPLGCHWQSAHPLKERIAMLKQPLPGAARLAAGFALAFGLSATTGYVAWASQPEQIVASQDTRNVGVADVHLYRDGKRVKSAHVSGTIGTSLTISDGDLHMAFHFDELTQDTVLISGKLTQGAEVLGNPILRIKRGSNGVIGIGEMRDDGKPTLGVEFVVPDATSVEEETSRADAAKVAQPASEQREDRRMQPPRYPVGALKRGAQGEVVLKVKVGRDGKALEAELDPKASTPNIDVELVTAARDAAMKWNFTPGQDDKGEATESWLAVPVTFSLEPDNQRSDPDVTNASYKRLLPPKYPEGATQGTTYVRVLVGEDGGIRASAVAVSSGDARLDEAALSAVQGWSFNPAHRNGEAMLQMVLVPVHFARKGVAPDAPPAWTMPVLDAIAIHP
jgi:bla regulator protein BlaR1